MKPVLANHSERKLKIFKHAKEIFGILKSNLFNTLNHMIWFKKPIEFHHRTNSLNELFNKATAYRKLVLKSTL